MGKSSDIKLGYSCNDACIHCVVANHRDKAKLLKKVDLNTEEYFKEIILSKNKEVTNIIVTGGEPTIRPDFLEIIKFIKNLNLNVDLQTNGRKLANKEFFLETCDYIDKYIVALHGPNSQIHEQITQRKNSFQETVNGIKNITNYNKNICGKIVLSKINYKYLKETINLFKELNVKLIVIAFPHSSGDKDYLEKIAPRYKQLKPYIEECIEEYKNEKDFLITFENVLPCALDKEYNLKYFADFFDKFNQTEIKMLNYERENWQKILHLIRKKDVKCKLCLYNNWCYGYWNEYVDKYGFDEFNPITKIKNKDILNISEIKD